MSDDSIAQEGVEAEAVLDEVAETVDLEATEAEDQADDQADDEPEEEEVEEIEFDFGGNKLRVPKDQIPPELAEKVGSFSKDLYADYTRKSQEVAESRKALEAREQVVEQLSTAHGEVLDAFAAGKAIKQQIEQLQAIDLNALWKSNPDQARRVSDTLSMKQAELQQAVRRVNDLETEAASIQQADIARRAEAGKAEVIKSIPNFDEKALIDYAVQSGIEPEAAQTWALNPTVSKLAWKAMQYDRMTAAAAKPKQKQHAETPVAPIKSKGTATGKKDLIKDADKMSSDEWLRQRNAQLQQRAS
jgi:hypothetical protein